MRWNVEQRGEKISYNIQQGADFKSLSAVSQAAKAQNKQQKHKQEQQQQQQQPKQQRQSAWQLQTFYKQFNTEDKGREANDAAKSNTPRGRSRAE